MAPYILGNRQQLDTTDGFSGCVRNRDVQPLNFQYTFSAA